MIEMQRGEREREGQSATEQANKSSNKEKKNRADQFSRNEQEAYPFDFHRDIRGDGGVIIYQMADKTDIRTTHDTVRILQTCIYGGERQEGEKGAS